MKAILNQIEEIGREYTPAPSRLSIRAGTPHKSRTWRSVALETLVTGLWVFLLLCGLYVAVGGCIGAVKGMWQSGNDLCAMFLKAVGR